MLRNRTFRQWLEESWTHRLLIYGLFVVSVSLIVQVVATVLLARL